MRRLWPELCVLGLLLLSLILMLSTDLLAGCRCNRAARKEYRQSKRAACRGHYSNYRPAAPTVPSYAPYPDHVETVGLAHDEPRWECNGRFCRLVPAKKPAPVPLKTGSSAPLFEPVASDPPNVE